MIKYWCSECGAENLTFDAIVTWSVKKQDWQVEDVGEPYAWCPQCFEDRHFASGTQENLDAFKEAKQ